MRYTRQNLINIYNATSKEHPKGSDKIESYEHWLERQLIARMAKIEKLEAKAIDFPSEQELIDKYKETYSPQIPAHKRNPITPSELQMLRFCLNYLQRQP